MYTYAGGTRFSPNTSHLIRKRTVNATLAMGHQADPAHCYKYLILQTNLQAFEQLLGISGLKPPWDSPKETGGPAESDQA